jgi:hypothetical protein
MTATSRAALRFAVVAALAAIAVTSISACAPDPSPTAGTSGSTTPGGATSPTTPPTSAPIPTATAGGGDISLPASCQTIYSSGMLSTLQTKNPPLNDPGITMYATQDADALQLLSSGAPTIRCTWGRAGSAGLATNVTVITTAQASALVTSFEQQGYGCTSANGGTLCQIAQKVLDQTTDAVHQTGEEQFVRGNGWIATHWIDFHPDGYTDDVVRTVWGG